MLVFVGGIWSLQTSQAGHWLVILCVVVIAAGIAKITKGNKRGRR
jgi:hypothetical protein